MIMKANPTKKSTSKNPDTTSGNSIFNTKLSATDEVSESSVPTGNLPRELYTVADIVAVTGIGRNVVYDLVHCGALPSLHIGSRFLVRPHTLRKFLEENEGKDLLELTAQLEEAAV